MFSGLLRLVECKFKRIGQSEHLSGGLHFRTKDRVDSRKHVEGEHCFLYAVMRDGFACQVQVGQLFAQHYSCSEASHWNIADPGYKRHSSRCAGVDLQDINLAVGNRILNIDKTLNLQLNGDSLCILLNRFLLLFRNADAWQNAGGITRMNPG